MASTAAARALEETRHLASAAEAASEAALAVASNLCVFVCVSVCVSEGRREKVG